jgi:hypothetical protein
MCFDNSFTMTVSLHGASLSVDQRLKPLLFWILATSYCLLAPVVSGKAIEP